MKYKLQILTNLSLFLIVLCFQLISAQENNKKVMDSLYLIANSTNYDDINKVDSYLKLSNIFLRENIDSAIVYVEKGKLLAEKNKNVQMVVKCLIQLARIKEVQNEIYGSLDYLTEAEKYYESIDKDYFYMTVCNYQGMYYEMLSNYDIAIEKYLIGLKVAKDINNLGFEAVFLSNLSIVYPKANQLDKSLSSSLEALAIYKEIGSKNQYFQTVKYVGNSYFNLGKYEIAKEHLKNAREYFEKSNDHIMLSDINLTLAKISMNTENQEEALQLYLIAQYHAIEMKDYNGEQNYKLALVNNSLGNVYLYFNDFSKAIQLFRTSVNIGKKIESNQILKESYKGLYLGYLALKELDSVAHYLGLFVPVNDSLLAESYNEKIDALNYDYELEQEREKFEKESEILILNKKKSQLIYILIISGLSFLVLTGVFIWFIQRSKLNKSVLVNQNLYLEKENLAYTLERKNKELTSSVLHLIERNEFISEISNHLENIISHKETIDFKKVNDIIRNIDKNINKKLWKQFELRYIEVHNDSFKKLSRLCPKLTSNDRRLCALIMLNMSTKEISSITYQSLQSIKIARYRLRKKLSLAKNENLTSFLNNL